MNQSLDSKQARSPRNQHMPIPPKPRTTSFNDNISVYSIQSDEDESSSLREHKDSNLNGTMNSDVSFDKNDIENSFYSSGSENMDENLINCNNIFNLNHYFDNDVDNQKLEDQDLSSSKIEDMDNSAKNPLDKT